MVNRVKCGIRGRARLGGILAVLILDRPGETLPGLIELGSWLAIDAGHLLEAQLHAPVEAL